MATRQCAACDAPVSASAGSCPKCACVLPAPTLTLASHGPAHPSARPDDSTCPSCGASVDADAAWCPLCFVPRSVSARFGFPSEPGPITFQAIGPTRGGGRAVRYASWDQRVLASAIDAALLIAMPLAARMYIRSLVLVSLVLAVVLVCWNVVYLQGTTGQTLGKMKVGISLVGDDDGHPIGTARCCCRQLAHSLDGVFYLGYLWPIWDRKHQTFADKLCRTVVVVS